MKQYLIEFLTDELIKPFLIAYCLLGTLMSFCVAIFWLAFTPIFGPYELWQIVILFWCGSAWGLTLLTMDHWD